VALVDDGRDGEMARSRIGRDGDLHAPHIVDLEVASQLRRAVSAGALDARRAEAGVDDLGALRITRYSHTIFLKRVWELRDNVTAYDAAYVALAEVLGVPLVTADKRLSRASGPHCEFELLA
jgi:predicted nucleic acid-binding protein